jgi:pimeloyl-ACP methyl ester carboxylesterase
MPGYGFSGLTTTQGWDVARIARAYAELMARLGYDRYGAHGGDWGAQVVSELARLDQRHVAGIQMHGFVAFPAGDPGELTASEQHRRGGCATGRPNEAGTPRSRAAGRRPSPTRWPTPRADCWASSPRPSTTWPAGLNSSAADTSPRSSPRTSWSATCGNSSPHALKQACPAARRLSERCPAVVLRKWLFRSQAGIAQVGRSGAGRLQPGLTGRLTL